MIETVEKGDLVVRWIYSCFFIGCFLLVLVAPRAWGDIYWFKDKQGVVHLSNVPVDNRFRFKEREKGERVQPAPYEYHGKHYDKLINRVAFEKGLDPALLHAVIYVESQYDPSAVSPRGAVGLMQLMPDTGKRMGVMDPYMPDQNLAGGARYLQLLLKRYKGQLRLALAAYNAGEGAVDRYKGIPPYPETENYVKKVLKIYNKRKTRWGDNLYGSRLSSKK